MIEIEMNDAEHCIAKKSAYKPLKFERIDTDV